jgi:hypothetical protein
MKITIPFTKVNPVDLATGGENSAADSLLVRLYDVAMRGGARPRLAGGVATLEIDGGNAGMVGLPAVLRIVRAGGEVLGKQAFIKTRVPDAPLPEAWPDRTHDVDGVTVTHSLTSWCAARRIFIERVGLDTYAACADGQHYFAGSTLAALMAAGIELVEGSELNAARAA